MPRPYPVTAEIDGRPYSGTWTLKQGGLICVGSAWGAKTVPLGRAKPEIAAKRILEQIVKEWRRKRERELRAWEAKRKRLNPGPPRC